MEPYLAANGVVSLVTAAALTAVILSRRVQEGVIIKAGLIVVALSLYASGLLSFVEAPVRGLMNSAFALRFGLLVVCIGVAVRAWSAHARTPRRRLSDFIRPRGEGSS